MTSGSDINLSSSGGNLRIDALTDIIFDAKNVRSYQNKPGSLLKAYISGQIVENEEW